MVKKWIQKAKPKKGALSRQLGIPESDNISTYLLEEIKATPNGRFIKYLHKGKYKYVKVTPLLKKRANFALNMRKRK